MVCKPLIVQHLPIVVLQLRVGGQRVPTDNISVAPEGGVHRTLVNLDRSLLP